MASNERNSTSVDSEREEGEIVDDLDDLSEISSEEEFLLRQRLQVLENYNKVLERKEAKLSQESGYTKKNNVDIVLCDLSEISATDLDENFISAINLKSKVVSHGFHKEKRKKVHDTTHKAKVLVKRKSRRVKEKKKLAPKIVSESSEEEDYEYRNKRRKLANAVTIQKVKIDQSSLRTRLNKMISSRNDCFKVVDSFKDKCNVLRNKNKFEDKIVNRPNGKTVVDHINTNKPEPCIELIDLCEDEDVVDSCTNKQEESNAEQMKVPTVEPEIEIENKVKSDSEEDLELLRQHALSSKSMKSDPVQTEPTSNVLSSGEDSDTKELRLICLKSAMLKKAMELKWKQKLKKRLSQSSNLGDDLLINAGLVKNGIENNTDIESVDMDVSDEPEEHEDVNQVFINSVDVNTEVIENIITLPNNEQNEYEVNLKLMEDETEEDEDLLRAQLLTSLSNNMPILVTPGQVPSPMKTVAKPPIKTVALAPIEVKIDEAKVSMKKVPEQKRFIINTKDSDSGSEYEATKDMLKRHSRLASVDFQDKLDEFLKSTRKQVENNVPGTIKGPITKTALKVPTKFIPKALNHLPRSEQMEYQNLVKRMAELEKIKSIRQNSMNNLKRTVGINGNEQPGVVRSSTTNFNVGEEIKLSRNKIAVESARLLKLKEDGTKYLHKHKIISTELRNLQTAISQNKREINLAQARLSKMRSQHQVLLKRSSSSMNKNYIAPSMSKHNTKVNHIVNTLKENAPFKDSENKNIDILKSVKVSIVNDLKEKRLADENISVQLEVNSNKKTVKIPKENVATKKIYLIDPNRNINAVNIKDNEVSEKEIDNSVNTLKEQIDNLNEVTSETLRVVSGKMRRNNDDYESPLQAILPAKKKHGRQIRPLSRIGVNDDDWNEDPHGVLCPFEVAGVCKDESCKYLHPKPNPKTQP